MLRVSSEKRLNHVITFRKSRRVNITTLNLITYTALSYLMSTYVCTGKNQWRLVQFWLPDFYTPSWFIKGAAWSLVQVLVIFFLYFNLKQKQFLKTMLAIYGFHSENLEKNILKKDCKLKPFCFLIQSVLLRRGHK